MTDNSDVNVENIMRILVATDNHLGYAEKDSIKGDDSFIAFEEILQYAVSEDVDFILLGGDLFHDAIPSQYTLQKCVKLLYHYTFGSKPIEIQFLNDDTYKFHSAINNTVNFENPNLNISYPVFSIHGNHDDPSGHGRLSTLDILSTAGLVNYFGRSTTDLLKINIEPLLLRKGDTRLALYGLSHIHDPRLARLFENRKVEFAQPQEDGKDSEWFHLMVLHQNRADRGPKNFIPEEMLPSFLHLAIWGHEHDCRLEPEYNPSRDFYVSQPGSSVPTSLSEGENIKKHIGLLQINRTSFQMKSLPLKTVRPFIFESVNLAELISELGLDEGGSAEKVKKMAEERVKSMIERSKELLTGHPKQPKLPLIRLRIIFTEEEQMFNTIRFGQAFQGQVANPMDVVHFKKAVRKVKKDGIKIDKESMEKAFETMDIDSGLRVEDLINRYFSEVDETKSLSILSAKACKEIVYRLVEHNDTDAVEQTANFYIEKTVEHLMESLPGDDDIKEEIRNIRHKIKDDDLLKMLMKKEENPMAKPLATTTTTSNRGRKTAPTEQNNGSGPQVLDTTSNTSTSAGKGRGRGRGGRGSRGAANQSIRQTVPSLETSINVKRSANQSTLLDLIGQRRGATQQTKKLPTYTIDDSD